MPHQPKPSPTADELGIRYVSHVPRSVPPGRILAHNHVRPPGFPNIPLGLNGFRAWTEPEDTPERLVCECGWAPNLPEHYRVDLEAAARNRA